MRLIDPEPANGNDPLAERAFREEQAQIWAEALLAAVVEVVVVISDRESPSRDD